VPRAKPLFSNEPVKTVFTYEELFIDPKPTELEAQEEQDPNQTESEDLPDAQTEPGDLLDPHQTESDDLSNSRN